MNRTKKILFAIIMIAIVYSVLSMATFSYFDDKEKSAGILATGIWPYIDTKSAILTGNGYNLLHNIFIIPDDGTYVIDKIIISWADDNGYKVNKAYLGGEKIWEGISGPGLEIDANYILDKKVNNRYRFDIDYNSDMHGKEFTIEIILENGMVIKEKFIPKWRDEKPSGWNSQTTGST